MAARCVAIVVLVIMLAGCLEPPVSETLEVRLRRGGASVVSVVVALRDPEDYGQSPRVRQRLESEAREFAAGSDPWSERLRRVEPDRQRDVVDREGGRLRRVQHLAGLGDPQDLREFFRDTGIGVAYGEGEGWAELTLTPGRPNRATSAQRQRLKGEMETFSENFAEYAAAVKPLYDYLETHPERARACLAEIVSDEKRDDRVNDDEQVLVTRVNDALGNLGVVLEPVSGEAFTLDELSRLVYDPFPAAMRVTVPGTILEREGYPGDLTADLKIPVLSLWSAFERLEGSWFAPDPLLAVWRHDIAKTGKPFDLDAFAAMPRHAAIAPTASEVESAIEHQLTPAPVYRVRFAPASTDAAEAEAEALTALPEPR